MYKTSAGSGRQSKFANSKELDKSATRIRCAGDHYA